MSQCRRVANHRAASFAWSRWVCLGLLLLSCISLLRADLAAAFEEANLLYGQGQARPAAVAYDRIWTNGFSSTALHFNLGNAWLKAGETGRAIHHYRLAQKLSPRDRDVAANLRLAREAVQDSTPFKPPVLRRATGWLTLDGWTILAALAFWIWLGTLIARQLRPAWSAKLHRLSRIAAVATITFSLLLVLAWSQHPALEAVVLDHETELRHGPLDEAPAVQPLSAGLELTVIDQKGAWIQVAGATRGIGWIKKDQVGLLPR